MGDGVRRGSRCQGYHRRVVGGVFAGSLGIGRGDYRARGFSVGGASRGRRAGDVAHALVSRNAPVYRNRFGRSGRYRGRRACRSAGRTAPLVGARVSPGVGRLGQARGAVLGRGRTGRDGCRGMDGKGYPPGERVRRLGDAAAIFVALSGAGWVLTSPTIRFFAPAFVVGLAGLVGTLLYLRRAGRMVALIVILVGGVWGTARFLDQHAAVFSSLQVALGRESADAYLSRQLDHFAAARFVQERLPPDARLLLIGETRPYYFYREAVVPFAYFFHPLHRCVH